MSRAMKNSGIPWIGEIPEKWKLERLKSQVVEINEKNSPLKTDYVLSLTIKDGVIPYEEKGDVGNKAKENHEEYKLAYPDTIVLNSMNILIGAVGICKYYGCVSPVYYVFKAADSSDLRYLNYIMSSTPYQKYLRKYANGILEIRLRVSSDDILKRHIPLPPLSEQQAIADFLDKKCAEIDQMVALQEKFIEELKAYKQSLITETVTKGLNPNAPMKDSGVECIGNVPQKWDVILLPFVFRNLDYLREPISAEQRSRKNPIYDYYGASGIIDKIDYYNVDDDVLLIGEDGANLRMRNLPLIYRATGKFWVNNHAHILKPIKNNIKFMQYMLEALDYNDFITGSAQPKLSQDNLAKVRVCVPPLSEQQAIADYLDKKCAEIDQLIAVKQKKADELKEYKKSIIYEYVTGKKEING